MAYLMSDVAAGSQAALQLQQNMAAAPNVQQVEANKMQEQQNTLQRQQVQIQQEQANAAKTNLANLVSDANIKASEKSKATLLDLYKTPEFQDAVNKQDNSAILKMTQVALFKAGDTEKAFELTSEVDKANAAKLTNQEKQNILDAQEVSKAHYNLEQGATLENLPKEQQDVLIKEVGKANWDKFTPEQKIDVTKNLMMITSKRLTNQLAAMQEDKLEQTGQNKKDVANINVDGKIRAKIIGEEHADARESSKESAAFVRKKLEEEGKDTRAEGRLTEKSWNDVNLRLDKVENPRITLNLKTIMDNANAARQKGPTGSMDQIKLDNNYRAAVKDYNDYQLKVAQRQLDIAVSSPDSFKEKKYVVDKLKHNVELFGGGTSVEEAEAKKGKPTPDKTTTPTESTSKPYLDSKGNVKPDWKRPDGSTKGPGWLGKQKSNSGKDMSEYSIGTEINGKEVDIPTFVPGLTQKEIDFLKTEPNVKDIPDSIFNKAKTHADKLISVGKSPFKEWDDTSLKEWNKGSKATSNKLTSEQQSWVDRAKAANPGMSEADIIAEGKKKGKL